ncbi:HAMP domain-containing protein [Psychromonas sp. KJ10-10]|uniref:HAMP domain-containing protein n=1 Tax=Psychromonas sp. KJ10-10 TaxID=3391823 RepID=UPI0039B6A72C
MAGYIHCKKINALYVLAFLMFVLSFSLIVYDSNQTVSALLNEISQLEKLPNTQEHQQFLQNHIYQLQSTHLYIYIISGFLPLILLATWWLSRYKLITPLVTLKQQIRQLASGDLTADIESNSNDEMGRISMALKLLQARFKTIFGQFMETAQDVVAYCGHSIEW